ncbi:MAG: hypothetical protein DRP56_10475 [Planctomycetota bacterium]|nr:MAG: hypothetical protein DRP56_10475 [Planctomycetota bacterium]
MEMYSDVTLIIMAAIFTIVLIVSYKSLSQMFDFEGGVTLILAVCVAALSIISLSDVFASFQTSTGDAGNPGFSCKFDVVLLPYIVLPLAILATVIVGFIMRLFRLYKRRDERKYSSWKKE